MATIRKILYPIVSLVLYFLYNFYISTLDRLFYEIYASVKQENLQEESLNENSQEESLNENLQEESLNKLKAKLEKLLEKTEPELDYVKKLTSLRPGEVPIESVNRVSEKDPVFQVFFSIFKRIFLDYKHSWQYLLIFIVIGAKEFNLKLIILDDPCPYYDGDFRSCSEEFHVEFFYLFWRTSARFFLILGYLDAYQDTLKRMGYNLDAQLAAIPGFVLILQFLQTVRPFYEKHPKFIELNSGSSSPNFI